MIQKLLGYLSRVVILKRDGTIGMKKILLSVLFFISLLFTLYSQQAYGNNLTTVQQTAVPQVLIPLDSLDPNADNLQLAISSHDYPVTPGDVYTLSFIMAGKPVTNTLLVESDYTINLDVLGKIDGRNMTFPELKPVIELIISDAYPRSMPSLTIQAVGSFQVTVTGAVLETEYIKAWGLSRLSDLIGPDFSKYASIRKVRILSVNGNEEFFDLLKAQKLGLTENDPYLKPGDTVSFQPVDSIVTVDGEVIRAGEFQILPDETTRDLLSFFGGFTNNADTGRIRIEKKGDNPETLFVSEKLFLDGVPLSNGDRVSIRKRITNQNVLYIEGGISGDNVSSVSDLEIGNDNTIITYNRVEHYFSPGDTIYDIVSDYFDVLSPYADLSRVQILRQDLNEKISIDMSGLNKNRTPGIDILVEPYDRLIIPEKRPFVSVVGAVVLPGRFPYSPPETAGYYISLAGGVDDSKNSGNKYLILDQSGARKSTSLPIEGGDTIQVLTNNFWYNFDTRFGTITTAALFITSAITLINVLNGN